MADVAIQSLLQGMKSDNKQVQGASSNIPNSKSSGFREFVDHYVSDADKFGGGVSIKRTMNFYKEGAIQETGMSYNIAIEGNKGLFYVSNNGEILNTRSGDFFKNKDDFVENVNGAFLMGLPYDENGVMAEVNETELRKVKINTVDVLEPLATSKVDVDLNLNASANIIGGGSRSLKFNSISNTNNDQSFEIKAYVKKNDGTVGEKRYKFIYKDSLPSSGVIIRKEGNVIEIEFNTAEQLKKVLTGGTDITSESNDKIKIQDVIGKAEYNSRDDILYFNARADKDGNVSSRIELVEGNDNGLLKTMGLVELSDPTKKGDVFKMKQNYSPYDSLNNMAGGNVKSDFSKEFTIIDDLGKKHVAIIALKRLDALKWASEIFVAKGEALSEKSRVDGLVSAGTIEFDSKTGKLAAQGITPPKSASMTSNVPIEETLTAQKKYTYKINSETVIINKGMTLHQIKEEINKAGGSNFKASVILGVNGNYRLRLETQNTASSEDLIKIDPQATAGIDSSTIDEAKDFLEINLGLQTEMKSITPLQKDTKLVFDWNQKIYGSASTQLELDFDKLTMYAQDFSGEANSNGRVPGFFQGISIDNDGNILGKYTNGDTKKLYNLPLGYFNNPGGLEPIDGEMFRESAESGSRKMALAGKEGTGRLVGERLELSNTDTNEQLTNVIEANSNYTAAAKAFGIKLRMNDTLYKEI